jgi:hypothetical protein
MISSWPVFIENTGQEEIIIAWAVQHIASWPEIAGVPGGF